MGRLQASFVALSVPEFRLLWSGSLLATTAFMTTFILVPIVAYDISGSYTQTGLAQMGMGFAQLLLGPFGGVIADRYPKKPLVLAGQIAPCIIIVATGILIVSDMITIPLLFGSTLLMGAAFALMGPARQSWVTELVPPRFLANSVALQQMSINVAAVVGPAMAALLYSVFGFDAGVLYLLVAALFVIVIPLTTMLPSSKPTPNPNRPSVRHELGEGFRYLRSRPRLNHLWLFWCMIVIAGFAFQTLAPGMLDREFGRDESEATVIWVVVGVAGLLINIPLAGLVSGRWAWPLLFATSCMMGLSLWLLAGAPTFMIFLGVSILFGLGRSGVMLVNQAVLMSNTQPQYFGRVMSWTMLAFGFQAFLAPVWGGLADAIGGRGTLFVVGIIVFAGTGLLVLGWLRTRHLPTEAGTGAAATAEPDSLPRPAARPAPAAAPSPAFSPAFAARVAPVVLMEGQRRGADAPLSGGGD